jgi:hypothetical protein
MPSLVIRREVGWERKETRYTILVDGAERGTIIQGQLVTLPVTAGRHQVQFKFGRFASVPLELTLVEGKNELLECGHELKAVPAFFGRLFMPRSFIRAKRRGTAFGAQ